MPPKRKYNNTKRATAKKYGAKPKRANASASTIQAAVRRAIYRDIETKQAQSSLSADYTQIGHNSFANIDNAVLYTSQGISAPLANSSACRIGDKITLLSVQFAMMLELNERYSDVSYRIMLVRSARGDTPTTTTLFTGLSGNKMLDTINNDRYTILFQKWGKMKPSGFSVGRRGIQDVSAAELATGMYLQNDASVTMSRATKIIKFSVPGKKFAKNGIIHYNDASGDQKFFDYNLLVYAYSNYSTSSALGYNVLAVNDYYHLLKFKDA